MKLPESLKISLGKMFRSSKTFLRPRIYTWESRRMGPCSLLAVLGRLGFYSQIWWIHVASDAWKETSQMAASAGCYLTLQNNLIL